MKVIIITRDNEYENSKALEYYSQKTPEKGIFITKYIENFFLNILTNRRSLLKETFISLIEKSELEKYEQEYKTHIANYSTSNEDEIKKLKANYWKNIYEKHILPQLEESLTPQGDSPNTNRPYVRFTIGNKDVNFVFLNRILGTFVDQNSFGRFTTGANLHGFIKAVCQDCEILDETGNLKTSDGGNYLYIHDKEWGCNGEKVVKFWNDWRENITNDNLRELLEKCFSKIIVFQHTSSSYHTSIKDLTFSSAAEIEDIIFNRGYF